MPTALVLPPFYNAAAAAPGILAFSGALLDHAASTEIELVLYNIPQLSRSACTPELIEALLARFASRIVGVKEPTGDLDNALSLHSAVPEFAIFTGDDRMMRAVRLAGGAGMIGGMPNLFAADAVRILGAPEAPETDAARAAATKWIEMVDGNGRIAVLKAMLAHQTGAPGWGDGLFTVCWQHELRCGDRDLLERAWLALARWTACIAEANRDHLRVNRVHNN